METAPGCLPARVGVATRQGAKPPRGIKFKGELCELHFAGQSFEHLGEALLQDYIYYRDLLQGELGNLSGSLKLGKSYHRFRAYLITDSA